MKYITIPFILAFLSMLAPIAAGPAIGKDNNGGNGRGNGGGNGGGRGGGNGGHKKPKFKCPEPLEGENCSCQCWAIATAR
ncbi:hypothetical protein FRC03_000503 [Tulasnella sp. 419]|nr:hypothetical protein FRC03_000503 [Tulasnella sp. 419]